MKTKPQLQLVRISLCGPSDVSKEIAIAKEVIDAWNHLHGEANGIVLKATHWSKDTYPEHGDRPQAIINKQMIDESEIIVAIFWLRFGTPTGAAASGTEEEINRAVSQGKQVMIYFSEIEAPNVPSSTDQTFALNQFRKSIRDKGLAHSFKSKRLFRSNFETHLALYLNDFSKKASLSSKKKSKRATKPKVMPISQVANGNNNTLVGGDFINSPNPVVIKTVLARREGSISASEELQISDWIKELVDSTTGKTLEEAYAHWWSRLKNLFKVKKYEDILSSDIPAVNDWFIQQRAIQKGNLKTKLPDQWRADAITAIKSAMRALWETNESYYPKLSRRLKMKTDFTSLKKLTDTDLKRVYTMVLGDQRKSGHH